MEASVTGSAPTSRARRLWTFALENKPLWQETLRSFVIHRHARARADAPPIAGGHIPFVGYALRYGLEGPELLRALRGAHGDIFTLRLMGKHITFCLTQELIERLYEAPYQEVSFLDGLKFFPGFGTVISLNASGPEDANVAVETLRRYLPPRVHSASDELDREVTLRLDKLAQKPRFELRADLGRCVVHLSACLLAGSDLARDDEFIEAMAEFDVLTQEMVRSVLVGRAVERARAGRGRVEPFLRAAIAARRGSESDSPRDFIEAMLLARDPQGRPFSDAVIASDLVGMMFGTTANTPAAAAMCLMHILEDEKLLARVRSELDEVRAGHGPTFDATALKKLTFLHACLTETLRVYAPGIHLRMLRRATRIGPYLLPKDQLVAISPYVLHHDANVYTDPDVFDPDRFLKGPRSPGGKPTSLHFVPFGRGLHACIGRTLAQQEVVLTIARLLTNYDVTLLSPGSARELEWGTAGIAAPKNPIYARLTRRVPSPNGRGVG